MLNTEGLLSQPSNSHYIMSIGIAIVHLRDSVEYFGAALVKTLYD